MYRLRPPLCTDFQSQLDSSPSALGRFRSFLLLFTLAIPLLIDEATRLANVPARKATSMASMTGVMYFYLQSKISTPAADMFATWSYTRMTWQVVAAPLFFKLRVSCDPDLVLIPE